MDAQPCASDETLPDNIHTLPFAAALAAIRRVPQQASSVGPEPTTLPQEAITELTQVFQIRDAEVDERQHRSHQCLAMR